MCNLGINTDSFNPKVLYTMKKKFSETDSVPYHSHDFITMIYVLSGSCTYNISNTLYHVKKGDMVICNPGVFHGKIINAGEEIMEFHIGLTNISLEGLPRNYLIPCGDCPVIVISRMEQDIVKCCSDIFLEQEKFEPGSEVMLKIHVMKLVVTFLKAAGLDSPCGRVPDFSFETYDKATVINTLVSFINENYMKEITLDTISKNIYLSPAYISKVFKEEMGESPINYLIKVRLAKAHELLVAGGMPVKAVAKSVGYDDAYHFSKLYKKYYNEPPLKSKRPESA
ncbi:MAG: AraC family transcriptional regulator [Ruminiclostridium sp.]|nr:AraC family transcriptional regulator [Ruminiclostridium sp.]